MDQSNTSMGLGRGFVKSLAAWVLTILLLAYVAMTTDLSAAADAVAGINAKLFLLMITVSVFLGYVYECWTLKVLFAYIGTTFRLREVLVLKGTAHLMEMVNYNAGNLMLSYAIGKAKGGAFLKNLGSLLVLMFADVLMMCLFSMFGLASRYPNWDGGYEEIIFAFSSLYSVGFCLALIFWRWEEQWTWLHRITRHGLFDAFRVMSPAMWGKILLIRIPPMLLFLGTDYVALLFFGVDIGVAAFLSVYPAVIVFRALPITVAGLGSGHIAARALMVGLIGAASASVVDPVALTDAYISALIGSVFLIKVLIGVVAAYFFFHHMKKNPVGD